MSIKLGSFPLSGSLAFRWASRASTGAAITRGTNGSIRIYQTNSTTERSSSAGITDTEDADGVTGVHLCHVDLADDTDPDFYAVGGRYQVVLVGAVIDGITTNVTLAEFSIVEGPPAPIEVGDGDVGAIVEMCFGGSYRSWLRERGAVSHFPLGDVGTTKVLNDIEFIQSTMQPLDNALYVGAPEKGYGLLPEYGLATSFAGGGQHVTYSSGLSGTGDPFTLLALVRPAVSGMGTTRCIMRTGSGGAGYLGVNASNQAVFGVRGGTLITSAAALVAGDEYLLVGTYDGTNGRLYVARLLEGEAIAVAGPTALTFSGAHNAGMIAADGTGEYFIGQLQGAAELPEALALVDIEALVATAVWIDVTEDVELTGGPLVVDRGIHEDGPLARIARPAVCTFALDNADTNTGGLLGYYSPPNANARAGFQRGIPVRVTLEVEEARAVQFLGTLKAFKAEAGQYLGRRTYCVATDWLDEAIRSPLAVLEAQVDTTADALILLLLNVMRNRPHGIAIADGTDVYPIAFDNLEEESTTTFAEFIKIAQSELGRFYVRGDGTLVFENRTSRDGGAALDYTLEDVLMIEQTQSTDQLKNRVKVTVKPRRVDAAATTVLYQNDQAIKIMHGVQTSIFLAFRDPISEAVRIGGLDLVLPPATFEVNSLEDGSGTNVTTDPTITTEFVESSNGVYLNILNLYGQPVWIQPGMQILGKGVYTYDAQTAIKEDPDSVAEHGLQEVTVDAPYQSDAAWAQGAAEILLQSYLASDTQAKSATFWPFQSQAFKEAALLGDISSRVRATEVVSGIDAEFWVNAKKIEIFDPLEHIDVTFYLTPGVGSEGGGAGGGEAGGIWTLDESALDEDTVLGL